MKKIITLLLSVLLIAGLAACGSDEGQQPSDEPVQNESQQTADDNGESKDSGKVLVAYFSATGNSKAVAEYIAEATGGDLFAIEPREPYTDADLNWTDDSSRVVYEHEHEGDRDVELVKDTVDNWDEYDTVFIGYPIWWGIAAWPVDGFVKANDFTGKTVIPFCTSTSSGIGESGTLLAEMAGTGDWQDGQRFSSAISAEDVKAWVEGLDL